MTRDEIVAMAREAGLQVAADYDYRGSFEKLTFPEREEFLKLLHFATLIEQRAFAAEREACARVAEDVGNRDCRTHAWDAAAAIRARDER